MSLFRNEGPKTMNSSSGSIASKMQIWLSASIFVAAVQRVIGSGTTEQAVTVYARRVTSAYYQIEAWCRARRGPWSV